MKAGDQAPYNGTYCARGPEKAKEPAELTVASLRRILCRGGPELLIGEPRPVGTADSSHPLRGGKRQDDHQCEQEKACRYEYCGHVPGSIGDHSPVTGPMALPSICAENCRLNALLLISVFVARIRMELADGITPAKQKP